MSERDDFLPAGIDDPEQDSGAAQSDAVQRRWNEGSPAPIEPSKRIIAQAEYGFGRGDKAASSMPEQNVADDPGAPNDPVAGKHPEPGETEWEHLPGAGQD